MSDFLGGMNPGFPSSFLSVIEESAPTNKLTNDAIRASKVVLSDKQALKQQANSDRFNNQTEGAIPVAQNDIEPPKADDYQRLAQRMGSGPVIDARLSEVRALNPFIQIEPIPVLNYQAHLNGSAALSIDVPTDAKFFSVLAEDAGAVLSFGGVADYNANANTVTINNGLLIPTDSPRFFYAGGTRQLSLDAGSAVVVSVAFYF